MPQNVQADLGKFILRFSVGFLMLFHGVAKIANGVGFIKMTLAKAGLPEILAYGVYLGEVIAPLLLIIGFKTRIAATVVMGTMVMAIYLVHRNELMELTQTGAWAIELPVFYILTCMTIILLGPGAYSADKK